jgi:hypothetical protein
MFAGALIGLLALTTKGVLLSCVCPDVWTIPSWGRMDSFSSDEKIALELQALALRVVALFLQQGHWFVGIPMLAACGLMKLGEIAPKYKAVGSLYRSLCFSLLLYSGMAVLGVLWGVVMILSFMPGISPVEFIYQCWFAALFAVWFPTLCPILPAIVAIYLVADLLRNFIWAEPMHFGLD